MKTPLHLKQTEDHGSRHPANGMRRTGVLGTTQATRLCLALGTITGLNLAIAQVSFTRILEGEIAEDTGLSIGCAWGDYDNDGYPDLIVADAWGTINRLYHNNGDGTFSRVTEGTIANDPGDSAAAVWGDYDNDGDLDLFVTSFDPPRDSFYRNEGDGQFTKVTEGTWVTDSGTGVGATWGDYDNDGFLDLYVANWRQNNFLYRNNGDGTMTQITSGPPVSSGGDSYGCTWADYDGDGDVDLFVAGVISDNEQQFLNNGDGSFTRVTTGHLVNSGSNDHGIACADYDNDRDLDLLVIGWSNRLYRNDGVEGLTPVAASGLESAVSENGAWGDYDNDGYLDLFISNYDKANFLFHNNGDGTFAQVTEGPVVQDRGRSCGCAWADYDNDGDLDLFVANGLDYLAGTLPPEPGFLYRNDGGSNHWFVLRLVGVASNRSAIGAKVRVRATIRGHTLWQLREVSGGSGYGSQNDLRVHFGLGDAESVEKVSIEWPSGVTQVLKDLAVNQHLEVEEDSIPLVALSFSEGGGTRTTSLGAEKCCGLLTKREGCPMFAPNIPAGAWAPRNNNASIDFGIISEGQGGYGIDFTDTLESLDAFTITGWLNARDLRAGDGGNRVVYALSSADRHGFELVQHADGSLQLGVNQPAANSPVRSSPAIVSESFDGAGDNWVFFAITYDSRETTANAQFYFGTGEQAAHPDPQGTIDCPQDVLEGCGPLSIGNVAPAAAGRDALGPDASCTFRGLLDEIEIYRRVLSLEEIQEVQRAPAARAIFEPELNGVRDGSDLVIQWEAARLFQLQECAYLETGVWRNVIRGIQVNGFVHTLRRTIGSQPNTFFRLLAD